MSDWTIILRSLSSRRFSTITTVATVSVAVALMLVLLAMRGAGRRAFEQGSGNMHLLVSRDADPLTALLNGVFYARPPRDAITWERFGQLAADPRVSPDPGPGLSPGFAIPIQVGDSYRGLPVVATTPEFFSRFRPAPERGWEFASGGAFDEDFECVAGASAAREGGLRLGQRIVLTHGTAGSRGGHVHGEFAFRIVGILRPTGSSHDRALFIPLQSSWILHAHDRRERAGLVAAHDSHDHDDDDHDHDDHGHDHGEAEALPTTAADLIDADRRITGVYLRVVTREGSNVAAGMQQLFDQLRRDATITVAQPRQEIDRLFAIVSNIDQILLGMAAVVMVSSGIAIMLALYNSMEQRRRQVAVLRVLGASRARIFFLVLTESAVIGLMGAAAGLVLCVVGLRIVAGIMRDRLGVVIETGLPLRETLAVAAGAVVLAALAGLAPAIVAYRTSVARSLRPLG